MTVKDSDSARLRPPKQPYQKPSFRHEKVFETMALSCGKVNINLAQCKFNRKNS